MFNHYKVLFNYLKNECKVNTNCGAGCPFGEYKNDRKHELGGYYICKLDSMNEEELEKAACNLIFK